MTPRDQHARDYASAQGASIMIYPPAHDGRIEGAAAAPVIRMLKEIFGGRWPSNG